MRIYRTLLAICVLLLSARLAIAEDIDVFIAPGQTAEPPNLLLIFDNAASFSADSNEPCVIDGVATDLSGKVGGVEQCALYNVIAGLVTEDTKATVNIGVMMYKKSGMTDYKGQPCRGSADAGGCLVHPIVPLTTANKAVMLNWIKSWKINDIKANNPATGATMQEAWAYFAGRTGLSRTDYADIQPSKGCGKNYVVFVGNSYGPSGTPGDQTSAKSPKSALEGTHAVSGINAFPAATTAEKAILTTKYTTSCGTYTLPSGNVHENGGFYADEWARYMAGQNIITYTVGVLGSSCQQSYAALLTSMADENVGKGRYFPTTDYKGLEIAMQTILSEVQSKDSVFASVSLPVSVNTQGTFLNQVYVGMFRPGEDSAPRWNGNLKQYKLGKVGDSIKLLDADDNEAISSSGSGFIAECARSFWTPTEQDSYWAFTKENCTGFSAKSNTPDGNVVEKGAQGHMVRSLSSCTTNASGTTTCTISTPRNVKTCSPTFGSCTALTNFNTSNTAITQAMLDPETDPTKMIARNTLINWAIGLDTEDENQNAQTTTDIRRSVHGDVVHSRPVAINYGTDAAPEVVVFYGANDGLLRAVNGNRTTSISSNGTTFAAGSELWSFMPPEFYGSIKRLYRNSPQIKYKDGNIANSTPKNYGMDGPITAYKDDSRAWVYATMRRGGRVLYAFDVTTPANPILKWKKGCPNNFPGTGAVSDADCTVGFSAIGQTWSSPKTVKARGYNSGNSPVLVFGGGYDTCEDADPQTCTSPKGNRIYVLDADTGALLNTLNTDRSVVGDVQIVRDEEGFAKYLYATDTGGNIYRVDVDEVPPTSWAVTKVASLGCDTVTTCSPNRKFLFGPDVVVEGDTNYILVGSGDREKPLASYTSAYSVKNHFFMVKDKPKEPSWLSEEATNCGGTSVICLSSLLSISSNANPTDADLASYKGWYLGLNAHEQVVTNSITLFGVTTFSTHEPTTANAVTCETDLGNARVYNIRYRNAASANGNENRYEDVDGGGLSPSPTAGVVILDDGSTEPFVIGARPTSPLEGGASPGSTLSVTQPKGRVFWYLEQ